MAKKRKSEKLITEEITREQAEQHFAEFAAADAKVQKLTAEMDIKLTKIREEYQSKLAEQAEIKDNAFKLLQHYATTNREELFTKKKSLELTHGTIGFQITSYACNVIKGKFTWESVVTLLKEFLPDYVRTKEEANKEALIADRDKPIMIKQEDGTLAPKLDEEGKPIPQSTLYSKVGVVVAQGETFYVEPKKETAVAA